jgi:hypothetical protein
MQAQRIRSIVQIGSIAGPAIALNLQLARLTWFASKYMSVSHLFWGGPWDVKQYGQRYEGLGNALYGYLGSAAGISPGTLRAVAGASQTRGPIRGLSPGQFFSGYVGDDPADYDHVSIGINSYMKGIDPSDYLR